MNNLKDAEHALYDDKAARPDFYNESWSFDPLQYLRRSTDEEGRVELSLDIKYRKHWFRLVYPQGQMRIHEKTISKEAAMFTVRVYADKNDDPENFLAEGTAIRYYGTNKQYERYFVDWAETMATGRALTSAGFDVPWCNKPTDNGAVNLYTGETISYDEDAAPAPLSESKRQYSDVTAPPQEEPIPELAGQQQFGTQTPAEQPATPATSQAAPVPAVNLPASPPVEPKDYTEALAMLSVEQAKSLVVNFNGKNKGKTLGQVAIESPGDIDWIANKYQGGNFKLKAGAKILTDAAIAQAS